MSRFVGWTLKVEGNKLILSTLFKETKEIEADIKEINFASGSSIILENLR